MKMRWDGGKAVKDLDVADYTSRFNVDYVSPKTLQNRFAALHGLTTLGKKLGLGDYDIFIADDFEPYTDMLVVHEAVEHWLRLKGWHYRDSDDYATLYVKDMFGDDPRYAKYAKM